jgi:hypothetical protein
MADQSRPLRGVAFTLPFQIFKADGSIIPNPGGLAGRTKNDADPTGAVMDNAPSVTDTTGGWCEVVVSAAEMTSDTTNVTVTSTDVGALPFSGVIFPAAAQVATAEDVATLATALAGADDAVLAAVAALPDDTDVADVLAAIALVKAKTDLISLGTISVVSATNTDGTWGPLTAGDDYVAGTISELSVTTGIPLDALGAGGVICNLGSITGVVCTVTPDDAGYKVAIPHLTAAQSAVLQPGSVIREFEALDASGFKTTFGRDTVIVEGDAV